MTALRAARRDGIPAVPIDSFPSWRAWGRNHAGKAVLRGSGGVRSILSPRERPFGTMPDVADARLVFMDLEEHEIIAERHHSPAP